MVDQNIVYGGLVAFAGLAVGAGMVALTEKAGVRSEERGALSYEVSDANVWMFEKCYVAGGAVSFGQQWEDEANTRGYCNMSRMRCAEGE